MLFKVPKLQEILYIPSVLEVLKQAWVQYIYVLIPVYLLLYVTLFGYVIENKVLTTVERSELQTATKIRM